MNRLSDMIFGTIKDGQFIPKSNYSVIQLSKLEGKNVEIREVKRMRSLSANNYLWGVVYQTISESVGHTPEELHSIFKKMFLPKKFIMWRGREVEAEPTTRLTTQEFSEYIEKVIIEASGLGIIIPPPDKEKLPEFISL